MKRAGEDDDIERRPDAFLLLHLEDGPLGRALLRLQLFLQESLGQADEHEQQVRKPLAVASRHRNDGDGLGEVLYAVVTVGGETFLVQITDDPVHLLVQLGLRLLRLRLVVQHEGRAGLGLPALHQIDLVHGDDERRLEPLEQLDGFQCLRFQSLVDVDDEDGKIGQRSAAGAQRGERLMSWRIDEQQAGNVELAFFADEWLADLVDMLYRHLGGPDVLSDQTSLSLGDRGASDAVKQ